MPVPPKSPSKRRRRNVPKSNGAATPTAAPAAPAQDRALGLDNPHPLIVSMWETLQSSCESAFYSEADWARLRMELWNANAVMTSGRPITGNAWSTVQHGLSELLISPAAKRRAAIELKAATPDHDEIAAVSMLDGYQRKLQSVKPE
jgi:hypothetical protein